MDSKIIIVGRAASGKTTLFDKFVQRGFKRGVLHTTRSPRVYSADMKRDRGFRDEVDGYDYHFISSDVYARMLEHSKFVVFNTYLGDAQYSYGLSEEEWATGEVFIFAPEYLRQLDAADRKRCFVIWLSPPEDVVRKRMLTRHASVDYAERRMTSDAESFDGFVDFDVRIVDSRYA